MDRSWRGVFPIVVTPFTEGLEMDEAGLRRVAAFCIEAGAKGLVGPAIAGEFFTLSDDERRRWLEIVIHEAGGQVPVIAGATCGHTLPAVEFSRFARDRGAACVMSMPPHILHPDAEGCFRHYEALSRALDIPVMIQNYAGPLGTPMPAPLIARMCRELPQARYIKEETASAPHLMSQVAEAAGPRCEGIFGGQGGLYLLDEYRRGASGSMPACQTTDLLQTVWDRLEAGQEQEARSLFNRILPLINYERLHGIALCKEVLYRRGVIACPAFRAPGPSLDALDRQELDSILADIEPLYRV
ncbi:MAG: dihydrodipicolinate synthase family protein [Armatimonadetes bacterium]|nr:dihydrodipicolinate synthase family protein [Armatimonadota bacterium]